MRKVLGEGQYGITREAKRRGGGEVFAVKTSSKKKIVSAAERRETKREIDMWFLKGHPNRQDSQPRVGPGLGGRPGGGWARGRARRGAYKTEIPVMPLPFPGMACGQRLTSGVDDPQVSTDSQPRGVEAGRMKHLTRSHHLAARRVAVRGRGAAARAVSDPAFDPALTVRRPAAPFPHAARRREGAHGGGGTAP